jgi:hypothetical protein
LLIAYEAINSSAPSGYEKKFNRRALRDRRAFSSKSIRKGILLGIFHSLCVLSVPLRFVVLFTILGIEIFLSPDPLRLKTGGVTKRKQRAQRSFSEKLSRVLAFNGSLETAPLYPLKSGR